MITTLRAGSRRSRLARWQTETILQQLQRAFPALQTETRFFDTRGDRLLGQPLPEIGGKGLFTAELEAALRQGDIDIAVHSLKDLPVQPAPGLGLGAITRRADPRDVLVAREGWTLATLPPGAVVGTSSRRRAAQLLAARPDLVVRSIRGNVETRIEKVMRGDYAAAVLAYAGISRLQLDHHISQILPPATMLPAPGQAALAVQCRADDEHVLSLLAAIDDEPTRRAVAAERTFLAALGGGCSAPVGALATVENGSVRLQVMVGAPDGAHLLRLAGCGPNGIALAESLAQQVRRKAPAVVLAALAQEAA